MRRRATFPGTGSVFACLKSSASIWQDALTNYGRQIIRGERHFKLYRQLKMYNDPSLNPAVYKKIQE